MAADTRELQAGEFGVEIKGAIEVWFVPTGGEAQHVTLKYPSSGYGGHEIVVSKNEKYVALWLHSGQSQVGYELFELSPKFRHVLSLPYQLGTGDAPKFSADAKWLVMLVRENDYWWMNEDGDTYSEDSDDDESDDDAHEDDDEDEHDDHDDEGDDEDHVGEGPWRLGWARLYVQPVPKGKLREVAIVVETEDPPGEQDFHDEWSVYDRLLAVGPDAATIKTPWGAKATIDYDDDETTLDYRQKKKR